jgi:hypothetical protein
MNVVTNSKKTTITLKGFYCWNFDKMMEACIYLAAKEYWENGGGKEQAERYFDKNSGHYYKNTDRNYLRLKYALKRFEGMTEKEIFDEWGFGVNDYNEFKYHKTIETLFELRRYMWN